MKKTPKKSRENIQFNVRVDRQIAAALPNRSAAEALALWQECALLLARFSQPSPEAPRPTTPMPPRFPASFADFLRAVVPGRTEADRLRNFREWVKAGEQPHNDLAENLPGFRKSKLDPGQVVAEWRKRPFLDAAEWTRAADDFARWWDVHLSSVRADAGRAGAKRPSAESRRNHFEPPASRKTGPLLTAAPPLPGGVLLLPDPSPGLPVHQPAVALPEARGAEMARSTRGTCERIRQTKPTRPPSAPGCNSGPRRKLPSSWDSASDPSRTSTRADCRSTASAPGATDMTGSPSWRGLKRPAALEVRGEVRPPLQDGKPVVIDEERGFPAVVSRSPEMWCVACGKRVPNPR